MKKKKLPTTKAAITYETNTDEAAVIAEAIERANSERNNKSSRATRNHPTTHPYIQGILTTPIGRNKTFRATETDDDDNDEAASNAEAIDSATAERSTTHKVMRIKQEYIPDTQGTHHFPPARSHQPQTELYDDSDDDDVADDDDYSVRDDDDRKIPAPTRPKSTRKRQFDDSDVPASSPDASPAKRMRFQTQKQPEIRYKTRQYVRECGSQQINFVGRSDLRTTKSKVRNASGVPRPAKQPTTYENRSDQSGDIAAQSDPIADPQFPISDHDHDRGDSHHQLPRVLDLGHIGPPRRTANDISTTIVQISFSTAAATFGSPSVHIFPHNANVILRPTGFEILPTPIRPRAPTPPSDVPSPNYQRPIRDQPNGHARVPNYNGDPVDDDEMTDASDDVPARSTTNIYRDDDMDDDDDDDSDVVNASSVFSIYCPCPKQLCLSVRDQTLPPTKAQKAPAADVEVEEQSNGNKKESPKQLDALPMIQNSPYSVPDSSDNDDSTDTSSFIPDSFTVKTLDSLTLMDRMTTRKATKNVKMTKNIPRPARPQPPTKSKQFATPINVANPFYVKPPINAAIPFTISIDDDETETPSTPSSRNRTQSCQVNYLKTFNTSGPRNLDAPPSPAISLNSELFSPLFSNLSSSNDSTFDCLSTSTGITAFLELSDDDETLELPYRLDKLHIPCPEDNVLDPIHHVPFCNTILIWIPEPIHMPHFFSMLMQLFKMTSMGQSPCATFQHVLIQVSQLQASAYVISSQIQSPNNAFAT
ncbi:hypothetical protein MHU86_2461 [Fragilaria crotonensis]|nr:hypothetical protein MHU86_2461 [Fragilaria crotonensis]